MSEKIKLPLFPLNLVLLPNEELTLHIFEDKYKEMVTNCINNNEDFGIILKSMKRKPTIGCTAQIVDIMFEDNDDEYDILIRGGRRFVVNKSTSSNSNLIYGNVSIFDIDDTIPFIILRDPIERYKTENRGMGKL